MNLFYSLADAFIMTFGITPPRPERRRAAALFISILLILMVAAILALFCLVLLRLFR